MKRLLLLSVATASFVTQAMASEVEFTFECKRVRPSEIIRALRPFAAFGVSSKEEGRKVIVTGGNPSLYKRIEELMEVIDVPRRGVAPRFFKLRFADATHVAGVVSEAFLRSYRHPCSRNHRR